MMMVMVFTAGGMVQVLKLAARVAEELRTHITDHGSQMTYKAFQKAVNECHYRVEFLVRPKKFRLLPLGMRKALDCGPVNAAYKVHHNRVPSRSNICSAVE